MEDPSTDVRRARTEKSHIVRIMEDAMKSVGELQLCQDIDNGESLLISTREAVE